MYDAVGFQWSALFTVGWNAAVFVAALSSLLGMHAFKLNSNNQYTLLEGGNMEYETIAKEVDMFTGEVQAHLSETDRYQTL